MGAEIESKNTFHVVSFATSGARSAPAARSVTTKKTKQVTTLAAAENGTVKGGLDVVILTSSLVPSAGPTYSNGPASLEPGGALTGRGECQGAFEGGWRSGGPTGWALKYSKICRATGAAAAAP